MTSSNSRVSTLGATFVTLKSGIQIAVPETLTSLTHFVLREHNGWYEPETEWLTKIIESGSTVIDVGAAYGVYALPLSKAVGEHGEVWAFEPTPQLREMLLESIRRNGISDLHVHDEAVANHEGEETFHPCEIPEFNSLVEIKNLKAVPFEVDTIALDPFFDREGIIKVDVLKISAMGAETLILEGAKHLLQTQSPLLIIKGRYGSAYNKSSVKVLSQYGYTFYRLLPELGILARYNEPEGVDASWSVVFACKADVAARLEKRDLLENASATPVAATVAQDAWKNFLQKLPFAKEHMQTWEKSTREKPAIGWLDYERALSLYAASRDPKLQRVQRLAYLRLALKMMHKICKEHTTLSRLQTLARIAYETGFKQLMTTAIEGILSQLEKGAMDPFEEPFIAVNERYEQLSIQPDARKWVQSGVLEQKEINGQITTYFSQRKSLEVFKLIEKMGYANEALKQKIDLLQKAITEACV